MHESERPLDLRGLEPSWGDPVRRIAEAGRARFHWRQRMRRAVAGVAFASCAALVLWLVPEGETPRSSDTLLFGLVARDLTMAELLSIGGLP